MDCHWCVISNIHCVTASAATLVNIRNAQKHFEKVEKLEGTTVVPKSSISRQHSI